jgi:PAS domain S-box-containing protein
MIMGEGAENIFQKVINRVRYGLCHKLYQDRDLSVLKRSEEIEQFFDVTVEMLCIANTDGYFTRLNPAWEQVLGWTSQELMEKKFLEFVHPDDRDITNQAIAKLAGQQKVVNFLNRYLCRDGTYKWLEWRGTPVNNTIYAAAQDITERRNIESALIGKNNILDAISYAATNLMTSLSDETIQEVLSRFGKAVGATRSYIFTHSYAPDGRSLVSIRYEWVKEGIPPQADNPVLQDVDWVNQGYKRWAEYLKKGRTIYGNPHNFPVEEQQFLLENRINSMAIIPIFSHKEFFGFLGFTNRADGQEWDDVELETLGAAAGLLGAAFERRRAEEEIKIRGDNLQAFFDTIEDFLFVINRDWVIEQVNGTVIRRLRYDKDELVGKSAFIIHPPSRYKDVEEIQKEILGGKCEFCQIPLITKDGKIIQVETKIISGTWNGNPVLFVVSKDITEISLSEEKFSKAFQASGSLMAILSVTGGYIDVNRSFLDVLGYKQEEVIGKMAADLDLSFHYEDREAIWSEVKRTGSIRNKKIQLKTKDNKVITGILSADIIWIQDNEALLVVINDVTEITRLSDALLSANKKLNLLSSITRHDILNQVQALFFLGEFLKDKVSQDSQGRSDLEKLLRAVETIHRQILFTRDYQDLGITAPAWMNVESVITREKENKIFSDISINVTTGSLEIFADPMFSKVCYNLLENSLRHGEHVTEIRVSFYESKEGGLLVFEDNGAGVPASEKKRIFNQGIGKNTGLGLFLTAEILSITGISIQETGEEGKGARFEISIPAEGFRYG